MWNHPGLAGPPSQKASLSPGAIDVLGEGFEGGRTEATWVVAGKQCLEFLTAHGFAWLKVYVEALRAMDGWGRRLREGGRFGEREELILRLAFAEYLARIAGGIPMNQVETVRPHDFGLGAREVVLASGQRAWRLPLEDLAGLWRGEFVTLWRAPGGYTAAVSLGARGPAVDALASGLARLRREAVPPAGQPFDEGLARRTAGFQLAWGLKPDGVAGPTTFMQLNRALGVAEPTLNPER